MPTRTHEIFAALTDAKTLAVLLALLEQGPRRPRELEADTGLSQSAVSRALRTLARVGIADRGNQRTPYRVLRPADTRAMIRAASLIEHEHTGSPAAAALAQLMLKQHMQRGADQDRAVG